MATPPNYTDAATVAAALRLQPDTTLSAGAAVGATQISVQADTIAGGMQLYPGMALALDQFNPGLREVATIGAPVTGTGPYVVPLAAALVNGHGVGAPVKEVSAIDEVVAAASRMVDDATFSAAGAFAQQSWTETRIGQARTDGSLFVEVSGRGVTAVTAFSWTYYPGGAALVVDPAAVRFDDYALVALPNAIINSDGVVSTLPLDPANKEVQVTVTYTAGYAPLPADLARVATVLAARLFKEGDTGFSDVVGSTELGVVSYKKGMPGDLAVMLKPWRRWS